MAVAAGHADLVRVGQGEMTDPAPGEGFRGSGSDSSGADHGDTGAAQPRQRVRSVKSADAGKAVGIGFGKNLHREANLAPRAGPLQVGAMRNLPA